MVPGREPLQADQRALAVAEPSGTQPGARAPCRRTTDGVVEHGKDEDGVLVRERGAPVDAPAEIAVGEALECAVLAGPAVQDVAAQVRAVVEREGEEGGRVGEAGSVDDGDAEGGVEGERGVAKRERVGAVGGEGGREAEVVQGSEGFGLGPAGRCTCVRGG